MSRPKRIHNTVILTVLFGMLLMLPATVFAIDIEETIWGFSNQPVQNKCVPLSLRISNNTPEVFDKTVQLNRLLFSGSKVGAPLYRKIYLAPYSSQWFQFYPYQVDGQREEWSLNWGPQFLEYRKITRAGNRSEAPTRVRVILSSSNSLLQQGTRFKRFPEELFPPFVTATDSLDEVILDHVPRWDPARRTSFLNWIEQGGVLHLLPDATGENLKFTSTLTKLNSPFEHFRIGAGLVIRHDAKMTELNSTKLNQRIAAVLAVESQALQTGGSNVIPETTAASQGDMIDEFRYGDVNSGILFQLSELSFPDHNWPIIYLMTLVYIFLIYPGCYLFQQREKKASYRKPLLFLLVTVGLFSLFFWSIGKRGYGEKTTINSLLVARPLSDNQLDLTCWMNCFVTGGGDYKFSAEGEGAIYTTTQFTERVRGGIFNGIDGYFISDIPPFSSRRVMYRVKAPYPTPQITVQEYEFEKNTENVILKKLILKTRTPLPPGIEKRKLIFGKYAYDLVPAAENDSTTLTLDKKRELLSTWNKYLDTDLLQGARFRTASSDQDEIRIYDGLYLHLIMKELNLLSEFRLQQYQGNHSRLQLFLYSEIPEELKIKTDVQGMQQGRVLFAYDLALPEKKNMTNHE